MADVGDPARTPSAFAYHRAVAPMLWVLVAVSSVELVVVHGLLALWRPWIAACVSVLTLGGLVWLISTIRSFRHLPVLVGPEAIVMRVGRLRGVTFTPADVKELRRDWTAAAIKAPGVLNLALVAYPNVVVDLHAPRRVGRRTIDSVAHRLDDPAGFAAAIEALRRLP